MSILYYCPECDKTYEVAYKQMDGQPICVVCSAVVELVDDVADDDILSELDDFVL